MNYLIYLWVIAIATGNEHIEWLQKKVCEQFLILKCLTGKDELLLIYLWQLNGFRQTTWSIVL